MGADYSRVRFDPQDDYSGIGFEQGRLVVDAELNEQNAITDRRQRAQVVDLAPSPTMVSRKTPKAFEITVAGGKISIGAGRMYVDGILAENHGDTPIFDPVLAESNGAGTVAYDKQKFWPTPKALPTGGTHLAFLDVWERERTHLNTPDLIESAIGVDTSVRTQIAWQVRLLENVGTDVSCGSEIPKWNELIAPSSARLTTGTIDVDPVTDPCEIPPGKGYRGPENQLYRVELHSATQFKWSRDNATVASAATVVTATQLRLDSLGRDDVLRIKDNDWVEITDDRRELNHLPGEMRKVSVNTANSTISFSGALPADLAPSTFHLRVRKWDSGLINIAWNGSAVPLEHGVTVAFSKTPTGQPKPGDYWVFAARATAPTPEESLEKLVASPPRGVHHHYARLALITMPGTVNSDCRPDWPVATGEGCECEICVTPQSHEDGTMTIQDAIEQLKNHGGGTVRLCPGDYQLDGPILLKEARSIRLIGSGKDSRIMARDVGIEMGYCQDVVLSDFGISSMADKPAIVLAEANVLTRIEHLWLTQKKGVGIGLSGVQQFLTISNCVIQSLVGIEALGENGLLTFGLSIRDNLISANDRGIDFSIGTEKFKAIQHNGLNSITGNTLSSCADFAIAITGLVPQDIGDVDGELVVSGNYIEVDGAGIITGNRARICDNTVITGNRSAMRHGIEVTSGPPDTPDGVAHVLSNKVTGFGESGIVIVARMRSAIVKQNIVRGCAAGILVQSYGDTGGAVGGHVAVDNNQVIDLRPVLAQTPGIVLPPAPGAVLANRRRGVAVMSDDEETIHLGPSGSDAVTVGLASDGGPAASVGMASAARGLSFFSQATIMLGIAVIGASDAAIVGNTVDGLAAEESDASQSRHIYGIIVSTCREVRISGNMVNRIGHPAAAVGNVYGVICGSWQDTVLVTDNIVLSGGPSPINRPSWTAIALVNGASQRVAGLRTVDSAAGRLSFAGSFAYLQAATLGHAELIGNTAHGGADDVAVTVLTMGDILASANRFAQPGNGEQIVARLTGATAAVQGNRVQGGHPSVSITVPKDLTGKLDAATVVGNITTGPIQINGTTLQTPWSALNVNA